MRKMTIVILNELEFKHHSSSQEPEYIDRPNPLQDCLYQRTVEATKFKLLQGKDWIFRKLRI